MISQFDKLSPYNYHPIDFDRAFQVGALKEARGDKVLEKLGEAEGLISALNPAPGHEQYAQEVSARYKNIFPEIYDKMEKEDMQGAIRKTYSAIGQFKNDPDVKNIINSREAYEKTWAPILNDPKNKGAIYNMPGILDDSGKFVPNRNQYSTLDYVPPSSYLDDINKYFSSLPIQESGYSSPGKVVPDAQGNRIFVQEEGTHEYRNTAGAVPSLAMQLTTPGDPNYNFLKRTWEKEHGPGTYTKENLEPWLKTIGKNWDIDRRKPNNKSQFIGESGNGSSGDNSIPVPHFIKNQTGQNMGTRSGIFNTQDNDIGVPYLGQSSWNIESSLGVDGRYSLGKNKYYIIGKDEGRTGKKGEGSNKNLNLYNTRVAQGGYAVFYKILPNLDSPDGKYEYSESQPGNIVTTGHDKGSVGETSPKISSPSFDGQHYFIFNNDHEKVYVEPFAGRILKGALKNDNTAEDTKNIIIEEVDRRTSLKYLGENFANEPYFNIQSTKDGATFKPNISNNDFRRLISQYYKDPKQDHSQVDNLMKAFNVVQNKKVLTPQDQQVILQVEELLKNAERHEALNDPDIVYPKSTYQAGSPMGTQSGK